MKRTDQTGPQPASRATESLHEIWKQLRPWNLQDYLDLSVSGEEQLWACAEGQSGTCNEHCKSPFSSRTFLSVRLTITLQWKSWTFDSHRCFVGVQEQRPVAFEWVSLWDLPFSGVLKKCKEGMVSLKRLFSVLTKVEINISLNCKCNYKLFYRYIFSPFG